MMHDSEDLDDVVINAIDDAERELAQKDSTRATFENRP
jgi:DNA-binding protein YbaB